MRIKSYFAPSVAHAMEKARVELGAEAMLMSSKKTDPELKHLGAYEVVFGVPSQPPPQRAPDIEVPALELPAPQDSLVQELAELRKQIESVKRSVSQAPQGPGATGVRRQPEMQDLQYRMISADFSEDFALEVIQAVEARISRQRSEGVRPFREIAQPVTTPDFLESTLVEELESRLSVAAGLSADGSKPRVVMLVGPPGAGKTTTLVKLAMRFGIGRGVPLQILSTDTVRVGGAEQLGAYARILGADFQAVHSTAGLAQALEEHRNKKLILIDTPGYDPGSMEESSELANFISKRPDIDVQLVVPANLRLKAALRIVERFKMLRATKVIFTHLDGAEGRAGMIELAIRSSLPISYVAYGQRIPEDIQEASEGQLTAGLFQSRRRAAVSAA